MTSRERLLRALNREKPDRLPASIHQWQKYHLDHYMGGLSALEAFQKVGLDAQISCEEVHLTPSRPSWREEAQVLHQGPEKTEVLHTIHTPEGVLTYKTVGNTKTTWISESLIKHDEDIHLIRKYMPVPRLDLRAVTAAYEHVGDHGILRGTVWGEQPGCWQHAACLVPVSDLIMATFDRPDWVHELLSILLEKKLDYIASMKGAKFDLVETGGGAASSTVISPAVFEEFCLPYDIRIHEALHDLGFKVTYHTCGGTRGIEDLIIQTGADASETLAPPSVGGNQEPWEFKQKVGNRIALIGGLDQFHVLTEGTPALIREKVEELFEKVGYEGGYVCSTSDHFFEAPEENLLAFAEAARACPYD